MVNKLLIILCFLLIPISNGICREYEDDPAFANAQLAQHIKIIETIANSFPQYQGKEKLLFESCIFTTSLRGGQMRGSVFTFEEAVNLIQMQNDRIYSNLCIGENDPNKIITLWEDVKKTYR